MFSTGCAADDAADGGSADASDISEGAEVSEDNSDSQSQTEPARGIHIGEVESNQGTKILIGNGAQWVEGADRTGYIIADRDTLLRIHYRVDDGWIPREIEARLILTDAEGEESTLSQVKMVEQDSQPYGIDGTFWFGLIAEAEQATAGMQYRIELWETETGAGEGLSEGTWANPADGPGLVGFEARTMQMKIMMVPVLYTFNGQNRLPDVEGNEQALIDNIYEQNPATEIITQIHAPYTYSSQMTDLGSLLPLMRMLRSSEQADPNIYYHAFLDHGGLSVGGVLGIALLTGDAKIAGDERVGATVLWEGNPAMGHDTFTHEVGHNQGLYHVECPGGGAAGPDPLYPYENGRIGNWGFGIRRFKIYDPDDAFDYMSYCSPTWVSDWTWNKTFARISTLTGWDSEGAVGDLPETTALLMTAIYPSGARDVWTATGVIDPEKVAGTDRMLFETNEGDVLEAWSAVEYMSDGETKWIATPMPEGIAVDDLDAIVHVSSSGGEGEVVKVIAPSDIGLPNLNTL